MVTLKSKLVTTGVNGAAVPVFGSSDTQTGSVVGVIVQAHTGTVYVGTQGVDADSGIKLDATTFDKLELPLSGNAIDLRQVYIAGGTTGDKALVLYCEKVGR